MIEIYVFIVFFRTISSSVESGELIAVIFFLRFSKLQKKKATFKSYLQMEHLLCIIVNEFTSWIFTKFIMVLSKKAQYRFPGNQNSNLIQQRFNGKYLSYRISGTKPRGTKQCSVDSRQSQRVLHCQSGYIAVMILLLKGIYIYIYIALVVCLL